MIKLACIVGKEVNLGFCCLPGNFFWQKTKHMYLQRYLEVKGVLWVLEG